MSEQPGNAAGTAEPNEAPESIYFDQPWKTSLKSRSFFDTLPNRQGGDFRRRRCEFSDEYRQRGPIFAVGISILLSLPFGALLAFIVYRVTH